MGADGATTQFHGGPEVQLVVDNQNARKSPAHHQIYKRDEKEMEILAFLIILGCVLIGIKLMGLIFRASIFLISIPLQILAAVILAIVLLAIIPVTLVTGVFAVILVPLGFLAPLLPLFLIGFGIYLLARK